MYTVYIALWIFLPIALLLIAGMFLWFGIKFLDVGGKGETIFCFIVTAVFVVCAILQAIFYPQTLGNLIQ